MDPSSGGKIVSACVKCAHCMGKRVCVCVAYTEEVNKGMVESCQSGEVP